VLWEHEVAGSNPAAPTGYDPSMRVIRGSELLDIGFT
jgi:hypothetical protein